MIPYSVREINLEDTHFKHTYIPSSTARLEARGTDGERPEPVGDGDRRPPLFSKFIAASVEL